jgi:hypothetical protein
MLINSSPEYPTTWAQEGIKFDPAPDVVDLGGRKIELIYVSATFVVGTEEVVRTRFIDPDFRRRIDLDSLVAALRDAR